MRSSLVHLLATFTTSAALCVAAPAALACDAGPDAHVTFALDAVGASDAEGDVTVNYHIVPYAQEDDPVDPCDEDPDDPECIDPCDEDPDDPECIDPCDEDPDDPECIDPCDEDPDDPECIDPCDEDPDDPACVDPCDEDPDDPECIDPCDEDPDDPECIDPVDPCDEDPDDPACDDTPPEPITGSLTFPLGDDEAHELPAGEADLEFELDGYETTVVHQSLCGDTTVRATLMSDEPVTFTAYVGRWQGDVPAAGAIVTLRGTGERMGERFDGEVDEDGQVEIQGVSAGLYKLEIWIGLGTSHELLELVDVDLLEDAHLSTRLRSSIDRPDYSIGCATFSAARGGAGSAGTMLLALFVMGQLVVLRRRDG